MATAKNDLEKHAYKAVVHAFLARADHLSMKQDDILGELRDLFKLTNEDHKNAKLEVIADKETTAKTSKKSKAAPPPAFHAAAPAKQKASKAAVTKPAHVSKAAPPSKVASKANQRKAGGGKGANAALPAVDPFVGKVIKIHDRVYNDDPDAEYYHDAVVLSYDEKRATHKLAFSFNKVNEKGETLEEYDDTNLYDMNENDWIDTGKVVDFSKLGAAIVVRSSSAAAAIPDVSAAAGGGAANVTATAAAATAAAAAAATTNGSIVIESEFFPDTALEVERAPDRQALQDIREKICEREHLIRMALDELRVADRPPAQEILATLEPSPPSAAGAAAAEGNGGGTSGAEAEAGLPASNDAAPIKTDEAVGEPAEAPAQAEAANGDSSAGGDDDGGEGSEGGAAPMDGIPDDVTPDKPPLSATVAPSAINGVEA